MRSLALETDEPGFNWRTLRFPGDLPRLKTMTEILSPLDPDLRPFKKRGGKLLMYHGWADPAISAYGTLDYHEKVTKAVGGAREADAFLRTYFVPGMHHCSGGPGPNSFDMLPVLEDWVERGVSPARVMATGQSTLASPLPAPAGRALLGKRRRQRCGELPLRSAVTRDSGFDARCSVLGTRGSVLGQA